jgi:sterol desaturase/sphingolipid hydroxylase (fatty acid hydroxylase superfamily)
MGEYFGIHNQILAVLTILTAILIIWESVFSRNHQLHWYEKKDTYTNLYLTFITILLNLGIAGTQLVLFEWAAQFKLFTIENAFWYYAFLFLAEDFLYFFLHLVDHYSRFFWAIHVTHHSSEKYNLTVGFRSSVFQPFYRMFYFLPLPIMGFEPVDILFIYQLTQTWGILVHTKSIGKMHPIIEYIFVTPSHHRVHHASNIPYLDKNMGMMLIIWDRIFGTFQEELTDDVPVYGLTKNPEDRGPVNIVFHEWKDLWRDVKSRKGFKNKILTIISPPGWSPDKSTLTANEMREQMKKL